MEVSFSDEELQHLVQHGSFDEVSQNVSLHHKDWRGKGGQSLLFWAALRKSEPHEGDSPSQISEAVRVTQHLVEEKGFDVDLRSERGWTPLFAAAKAGNVEVLQYLIKKGADVKWADKIKQTAAFFAAAGCDDANRFRCLKALIEAQADVSHRDSFGQTILFHAAKAAAATEAIATILQAQRQLAGGDEVALREIAKPDTLLQQTPLFYAVQHSTAEACKQLIEARCFANDLDCNMQTPLFYAAKVGRLDTVRVLLNASPPSPVDAHDRSKETALFYAVERSRTEVCRLLLEGNADPHLQNVYGWSSAGLALRASIERPPEFLTLFRSVPPSLVPIGLSPVKPQKPASKGRVRANLQMFAEQPAAGINTRSLRRANSITSVSTLGATPTPPAKKRRGRLKDDDDVSCVGSVVSAAASTFVADGRRIYRIQFGSKPVDSAEYEAQLRSLATQCPWLQVDRWTGKALRA